SGTTPGIAAVAHGNPRRSGGAAAPQVSLPTSAATGTAAMIRWILLCLLALLSPLVQATLDASVDRTRLVEGEALELTLETPTASRLSDLDLGPLEENFEVQRTRQLSLVSQVGGKTT